MADGGENGVGVIVHRYGLIADQDRFQHTPNQEFFLRQAVLQQVLLQEAHIVLHDLHEIAAGAALCPSAKNFRWHVFGEGSAA